MAIISSGITTLTDLNDAIISGTQPVNPTVGTLWIDSSTTPAVLKIYKNGAWVTQDLDLDSLDPDMAESIRNVVATIGNMSNDNLLDYKERQIIKDDLTEILGKVILDTETVLPTVSQLDSLAKGSFYSTRQNALNAGLEKTNSVYVNTATQYQNLKTYLESLTPVKPWNTDVANKDKNVTVVKNTFRDKWLQYYLSTETLSLATTEKIKQAQEELDGKIDEVSLRDKTEILSGNPVFTDNSDDAVVHVGVDGKSEQNAGSGKNLIGYKEIKNYPARSGYLDTHNVTLTVKPNTVYTVSSNVPQDAGGYNVLYFNGLAGSDCPFIGNKVTKTSDSLGNLYILVFEKRTNGTKVMDGTYYIQLEEGNTATAYEEYKPPAPSPDYPIAINSLDKSFDIVSSVGKENILTGDYDEYKSVTFSGWEHSLEYLTSKVQAGDTLTAKAYLKAYEQDALIMIDSRMGSNLKQHAGNIIKAGSEGYSTVTMTLADGYADNVRVVLRHTLGSIPSSKVDYKLVKVEKSSSDTPYSQAPANIQPDNQTSTLYKTNISLPEPLRSVGDVKDRLFRDTDDLWKIERKVGHEKTWNSYVWNLMETTDDFYRFVLSTAINISKNMSSHILSTHFESLEAIKSNTITVHPSGGLQVRISKALVGNTSQSFVNYLDTNNVSIQYLLATPTIETLSAEQQTKLNNIQSFKGSNYVYSVGNVTPNLRARFKSNAWYRVNVLGEQLTYGNRNWARNGNLAYLLEDSAWSGYYKGTVREIVDISSDAPPFKNALHIKQTTSGVAGIVDAVIWEGAEANVLTGQNISMATWLKYQNIANSDLVMQVQVTGKKSDGTFVYDYPKVFSSTGTDMTWQRRTGTVKINLFEGATEITRVVFRLGFAKAGTGEFWATGIQLETGTALGDWSPNPDDVQGDLDATKAQLILTEKEVALRVTKGNVVNEVNVDPTGVRIKGKKFTVDADTEFNANLTMNKGVIKSADGGTVLDLNNNTLSLDKPFSIGNTKSATTDDVGKAVDELEVGGTNLLPLSSLRDSASFDSFSPGNGTTSQLFDGQYTLLNRATDNGTRGTFQKRTAIDFSGSLKPDDTITMSIEVYVGALPSDGTTAFVRWLTSSGAMAGDTTIAINSNVEKYKWVKLSNVITVPSNTDMSKSVFASIAIQGTASMRVRNFQIEKGNKATDWSPAPEDIQAGIDSAQKEATNAKNSATSANQLLADLSNDNILTPVEKKSVKKEWDIITGEKNKITGEATEYSITGEQNAYITQYNNLQTYITPLLANLNANSTIIGTTFRTNFKNYYDARQDLLNAITSKAKALADLAQGTADVTKGIISNFDSSIINPNPIFLDWTGNLPAGYPSSAEGTSLAKVASSNGMGNALRYTVVAGANSYLNPDTVTTFPYSQYIAIEATFKLDSGTIDGSGILFRYTATSNVDFYIRFKDLVPTPVYGKWYTVSTVVKQPTNPAGFYGYQMYPMGGWTGFTPITAKVIQFDSMKARQATEQEINAYESNIMIADMSTDSKITPVEKVQLKKEWATINAERASLDGLASSYGAGVATERTNMTNAYNTLNTVLNGSGGILLTMSSTSTVVATTFRAQFDDYYEKKALLQKKVNELAKTLADKAQTDIDGLEVGGRNIVLKSDTPQTRTGTGWITWELSKSFGSGEHTVTIEYINTTANSGGLGLGTGIGYDGGYDEYPVAPQGSGTYRKTFNLTKVTGNTHLNYWVNANTTVNRIKLEKGNKATDWTPAPEDVDADIAQAKTLANNASTLAGTKAETYTSTPTIPYKSGDVWRNGSAVYISTATRSSGSFTSADWVLVGDVTSANTAKDVTNVGGTLATTIRDRATNGNTAYASTSLWKTVGKVTFDGGNLEADTITSGAIISDVGIINKLFASTANINTLTAKTAFINNIKAIDITADRVKTGVLTGTNGDWNLNTGVMNFYNPSTADNLQFTQGEIQFRNGSQGRYLRYQSEGLRLVPFAGNTGTSKNTALHLIGGGSGSYQYIQFVSQEVGGISMRLEAEGQIMTAYHGSSGSLNIAKYGEGSNSGLVISGAYETRHSSGVSLRIAGDSISTPRDGARNIYLTPQGTGSTVSGNASGVRYNMVASDFVKQSTRDSKTDIKPIETKGLDVINRLNPVSYKKKDKVAQGIIETELGFIAEDSLEVATVDGLGIYDSHITAYLVKAVQELNTELKELKK